MNLVQRMATAGAIVAALSGEAQAQERPRDIEEYATRIKGGIFGRGGWLNNLDPSEASADKKSSYRQALDGITAFLQVYDESTLPEKYKELHRSCVHALMQNLFVENHLPAGAGVEVPGINDMIRESLKKERVLDFRKQLEEMLDQSNDALNAARTVDKEQREVLREYNESIAAHADRAIELMLATRYKPKHVDVDTKQLEEIVETHKKAYHELKGLKEALAKNDYTDAAKKLQGWKSKQSEGFRMLIQLQKDAAAEAIYATGRWTTVNAFDDGKPYVLHVTRQFADDWGERGEKMYGPREQIQSNTRKMDAIKAKIQTDFSVDYADKMSKKSLTEGRLPTVVWEAVMPHALAEVFDCGDKITMHRRTKDRSPSTDGEFTIVGFCVEEKMYLTGKPGYFLPEDLANWKVEYQPKYSKLGKHHATMDKKD